MDYPNDPERLRIGGVAAWNAWRLQYPDIKPDLVMASLMNRDLQGVDLHDTNLSWADLISSNLSGANLTGAILEGVDARFCKFVGANLQKADLHGATLIESDLSQADLSGARVYGISSWNIKTEGALQQGLCITPPSEPKITVDNLEVAQFLYLILKNEKLKSVIDTITSKAVLILGRFTPERKIMLNWLRDELRARDYLPIIFDFSKPEQGSLMETVRTLAGMARFIIADVTDATMVREEVGSLVMEYPSKPIQPIVLLGCPLYDSLIEHIQRYRNVLRVYEYTTTDKIAGLSCLTKIIKSAEKWLLAEHKRVATMHVMVQRSKRK